MMRKAVAARYFRLFLPVCASCLIVYSLANAGLFRNEELTRYLGKSVTDTHKYYIGFAPSLLETLRFSFWDCPFLMKNYFNPPLWTISYEFWGSLLIYIILMLVGTQIRRFWAYGIVFFVLLLIQPNFSGFILGLWLADIKRSVKWDIFSGKMRVVKLTVLVLLGLYALAVWSGYAVMDRLSQLAWSRLPRLDAVLSAAALLFVVDFGPTWLQNILSWRPFAFLGQASLGVYLLHQPVLCSFGASLFLLLNMELGSRGVATVITATVSVPVILFCGWIFHYSIDVPSVRFSKVVGGLFR